MRSTSLRILDAVSPACVVIAIAAVYLIAIAVGQSTVDAIDKAALLPSVVGALMALSTNFRKASEEYELAVVTAFVGAMTCCFCVMWMTMTIASGITFSMYLVAVSILCVSVGCSISKVTRLLPKLLIAPTVVLGFYLFSQHFVLFDLWSLCLALIIQFLWTAKDWPFWVQLEQWAAKR